MKNFFCFLLIAGTAIITGCQNPLNGIDKVQTHIENVDSLKEKNILKTEEYKENSESNDAAEKDNSKNSYSREAEKDKSEVKTTFNSNPDTNDDNKVDEVVSVTAYYRDSDGLLIPVTRNIKKEEGIAKAAIRTMIDNEINREALKPLGLVPVLPEGTEVLGINIVDGIAIIDLSNKVLNYKTEQDERNIFSGIVYTLTEFKTINGVQFLINGYEKKELKYSGNISNIMTRDNTLINSDRLNAESKTMKFDVYLYKYLENKHEYLLPVSMEYIGVSKDLIPVQIVRTMAKEPKDSKLYTQMPENVELIGSKVDDKVLTLDFSKEIKNYGGNSREEGLLKQILYTMKQIKGVEKVEILIEGEKDDLPEGTDISSALRIPDGINRVSE
ncbi:MAG TPA: GerMN domain-containing protein [Acetivibrio clariflavus]|nr:GerMN domain-containing protein [Acetivibrio clariflavus]